MTDDPGDEPDVVMVEDLSPETIEAVATRIRSSSGFTARVDRESEMDALWTLADMAAAAMRPNQWRGPPRPPRPELPFAAAEDFSALCALIFQAHDLNAEGHSDEAAAVLLSAAEMCKALRRG